MTKNNQSITLVAGLPYGDFDTQTSYLTPPKK